MIRVMIVEDQILIRDALAQALDSDPQIQVVAMISDAKDALDFCTPHRVDLILMDICTANNSSGIEAAEHIKSKRPGVKIVLMTGLPELTFIDHAKKVHADSFVYKDIPISELIQVIYSTMQGEQTFPNHTSLKPSFHYDDLTDKEREVLFLICEGLSRQEIASTLFITENTVKTHFSNILSKTGFTSISKLAIYAVSSGLINPGTR